MKRLSDQNEKLITAARAKGKRYKTKWPMHVGMALAAMDTVANAFQAGENKEALNKWLAEMKGNPALLQSSLLYFKLSRCYDEKFKKLAWKCEPGSETHQCLSKVLKEYCSTNGGVEKLGIAPRSNLERRIIKLAYPKEKQRR